ncbi:hypothetical protein AX17_002619 [Amanita inopinata Kibby_2008]|nr:hypothetical protein AX17_002619 [Amanita inopinata Kibby_2008]
MDPQARSYTLQLYNCYFVARTITTLMVRHLLLRHHASRSGLRWDAVTETAISDYIFHNDWNALNAAMKSAVITVLENLLWPVVKADAETLIEKRKHWGQLESAVKQVIHDTVESSTRNLVDDPVKKGINEWLMEATRATLWHDNLEINLSAPRYRLTYEMATDNLLKDTVRPELQTKLPDDMVIGLANILPQRLLSRLPPEFLANLPGELLGKIPARVLKKLPDDLLARAPNDVLLKAPDEFFQKFPARMYSKFPNEVLLSLPEDLGRIPDELLDISLQRIQDVLERPDDPDKLLALKLLQRLSDHAKQRLPPGFIYKRSKVADNQPEMQTWDVECYTDVSEPSATHTARSKRSTLSLSEISILGVIIRVMPRPVLEWTPAILINHIPTSWLRTVPAEALIPLPPKYLAKLSVPFLERLPDELLDRLPETLLQNLPHTTLQKIPDKLLTRLPVKVVKNLPVELLENLPEELSDSLREKISTQAFNGPEMMEEITKTVGNLAKGALLETKGELLDSVLRASVRSKSKVNLSDDVFKKCCVPDLTLMTYRRRTNMFFSS